jgi:hypothetical protein
LRSTINNLICLQSTHCNTLRTLDDTINVIKNKIRLINELELDISKGATRVMLTEMTTTLRNLAQQHMETRRLYDQVTKDINILTAFK